MFCMTDSWLKKSLGKLEFSIFNLKDFKLKSLFSQECPLITTEASGRRERNEKEKRK